MNEICEIIKRNRAEAQTEERVEERLSLMTNLVKPNKLSIKEAADEADMTEADFKKLVFQ